MSDTNITTVFLRRCCASATANSSLYQFDHGQILKISGVELPETYTVDFCNVGDSETMPHIGNADGVSIPDDFLKSGKAINAFIWLSDETHGETRYKVTINVRPRPKRGDAEPTPEQQTVIDQLITELNNGVAHVDEVAENLQESPFAPGTGTATAVLTNSSRPNVASAAGAVAMGAGAVASGQCAVASGTGSGNKAPTASGLCAVAMGRAVTASGNNSQAFGQQTVADGAMSTAIGNYTIATGRASFVAGQYNAPDDNPVDTTHGSGARKYVLIVGNGTSEENRSNAATVDWDGNLEIAGNITIGNTTLTEAQLIRLLELLN